MGCRPNGLRQALGLPCRRWRCDHSSSCQSCRLISTSFSLGRRLKYLPGDSCVLQVVKKATLVVLALTLINTGHWNVAVGIWVLWAVVPSSMQDTTGTSDLEHTTLMWLMWLESLCVLDSRAAAWVGNATSATVQWRDSVWSCAKKGIPETGESSFDDGGLRREGEKS